MSSNNRIRFDGLDELKAALRKLPERLTAVATEIVEATARETKAEVSAAYPTGPTGNLKRLVVISRWNGRYVTGAVVKNNAPHAYIFEHGTQVRKTSLGQNRGRMPPGRVFIPIVVRKRREMLERLKAMVEREGLMVSGDA